MISKGPSGSSNILWIQWLYSVTEKKLQFWMKWKGGWIEKAPHTQETHTCGLHL